MPFATRTLRFSDVLRDLFTGDLKVFEGRFLLAFLWGEKLSYAKAAPEEGARVDCA